MFAQKMPISSVQDVKIFNNALKNVKQMIGIIIRNNVMKAMLNFSMNLTKVKKVSFIQLRLHQKVGNIKLKMIMFLKANVGMMKTRLIKTLK